MAKMTKAQREWRPNMKKKPRSVKVMFASTVLGLEAFVVFFVSLVVFGMKILDPGWALGGGAVLFVVFVTACAILKKPYGYPTGWILQLVLIATGFLVPTMFVVGLLFALTWWYGLRTGARLDRETAQRVREQARWEREHPGAGADDAGPGPVH